MKNLILTAVMTGLIMNIAPRNSLAAHPELARLDQIKFSVPPVSRYQLDNGLVVYAVKDNTLPMIHVSALVHTGSARDPQGKTGLASLTVQLLRDGGTARYKAEEIDKTLEYLGAQLDAAAYTEDSLAEMSVLKKDFGRALDIYADVMRNPAFEAEKVKIARDETLEVIRRRNDDPSRSLGREAKRMFYGKEHPYGRRIEAETINAVTTDDMKAFYSQYFRPNNTVLVVSGDYSSDEELLKEIKARFGDWQRADVPEFKAPAAAYAGGRQIYFINKATPQAFIAILQKGVQRTSAENYPLTILTDILGGGLQSRMFVEVRTKRGLAYSVGTYPAEYSQSGYIATTCGTKPETYSQALTEMLHQLKYAGEAPVTPAELERSKGATINPFVFKFSTPHKLAMQKAEEEFYGFPKGYLDNYVEKISGVTQGSVLDAGKRFLNPDDALIFVIGDARKFDKPLSDFGVVTELKED